MIYFTSQELLSWATTISSLIIITKQHLNASKAKKSAEEVKQTAIEAKQHAQDAAIVSIQTFHLIDGQMTVQIKRNAALANKVAQLLPEDEEAQAQAVDANEAVKEKVIADKQLADMNTSKPLDDLHKLSESKGP